MKTDHNRVSSVSSLYRKSLFCHIIGAACCLHFLSVLSKYYLPRSWHFFLFKKKMWNIFRISILPHNWSHLSLSFFTFYTPLPLFAFTFHFHLIEKLVRANVSKISFAAWLDPLSSVLLARPSCGCCLLQFQLK